MKNKSRLLGLLIVVVLAVGAFWYFSLVLSEWHFITKPVPPLHMAVWVGSELDVKSLISAGANINEVAAFNGRAGRETPLCVAAQKGKDCMVDILVEHGASVDKCSPLSLAVQMGHVSTATILLDAGANPNGGYFTKRNAPLECAIDSGKLEMVELLVSRGAKMRRDDPMISVAAANGSTDIVRFLASKGVNVALRSESGWTPLHAAASCGRLDTVKALLELGADPNVKNNNGETPARVAAVAGFNEIAELLRQSERHD